MKKELYKKSGQLESTVVVTGANDYHKIFNIFQDNNFYAYNIIKTINIPADLQPGMTDYVRVNGAMSWTHISFQVYGNIKLWWLICIVNKIMNPVLLPEPGTILKVIKPEYLQDVLTQINNQI